VRPFSNGSEYEFWSSHNCESCRKDYDPETDVTLCPMEGAIALAAVGDGTIPDDLAARIGVETEPYVRLRDRCKEWQARP
jgi:hypothetical protein